MNWKQYLSVSLATFAGGAVGYAQTYMSGAITGSLPWKQVILGACLTGVVAVVHLLMPAPLSKPS